MNSGNLRRREHGEQSNVRDVGESESLIEPLLHQKPVDEDKWDEKRKETKPAWNQIFGGLITKWAKWFVEVVANSAIWLGNMLLCGCAHQRGHGNKFITNDLRPIQEERLLKLQQRLEVPFDGTHPNHQETLRALWQVTFPDRDLHSLISEQWKDMGWQGNDPSTDFRGGGFISLENLLFFAKTYPKSFQQLLQKQGGRRATWEYPFAVAGVNITFMLIQMLDLRSAKPSSWTGLNFLKILAEEEIAFDLLYCVAFKVMDTLWLAMRASYMEFNVHQSIASTTMYLKILCPKVQHHFIREQIQLEVIDITYCKSEDQVADIFTKALSRDKAVMKATRAQLEQELSLVSVSRIEDLPSYALLFK